MDPRRWKQLHLLFLTHPSLLQTKLTWFADDHKNTKICSALATSRRSPVQGGLSRSIDISDVRCRGTYG